MKDKTIGSCLCGGVVFEVKGQLRPIMLCHCSQCRKTSGHYVAATSCPTGNLSVIGSTNLNWYQSSDKAKRAFCTICGSQLFWRAEGSGETSIFAGSIDGDTGLHTQNQLYTENKGDYYATPDVETIDQEKKQ